MLHESRLLYRYAAPQPRVEIEMDAILSAGNYLMRQSGKVEHGFVLAGERVLDEQGRVTLRVKQVLSAGSGGANTFDVSPKLARRIEQYPFSQRQKFLGFGHSHRRNHQAQPSPGDLEYARRLGNERVHMVIKLEEDANGNRNGGAKLSVYDNHGYLDYTIVGANGERQDFSADVMGTTIDAPRLKSDSRPVPAPQSILAA